MTIFLRCTKSPTAVKLDQAEGIESAGDKITSERPAVEVSEPTAQVEPTQVAGVAAVPDEEDEEYEDEEAC